jgi:hypothetical protein
MRLYNKERITDFTIEEVEKKMRLIYEEVIGN